MKLLDRQIQLARYLAGSELIFGGEKPADVAQDPSLHGISIPHLRLEAEMSFAKRMGKIGKVFRRTFSFLGQQRPRVFREFATAYLPKSYRKTDDALCFYEFLQSYWVLVLPTPPFIADVAKLEIALAKVAAFRESEQDVRCSISAELSQRRPLIRLSRGAEILQMDYNLRPLFESKDGTEMPAYRETCVLVAQMFHGRSPSIIEVPAAMRRLREWTAVEDFLEEIGVEGHDPKKFLHNFRNTGALETIQ